MPSFDGESSSEADLGSQELCEKGAGLVEVHEDGPQSEGLSFVQ